MTEEINKVEHKRINSRNKLIIDLVKKHQAAVSTSSIDDARYYARIITERLIRESREFYIAWSVDPFFPYLRHEVYDINGNIDIEQSETRYSLNHTDPLLINIYHYCCRFGFIKHYQYNVETKELEVMY